MTFWDGSRWVAEPAARRRRTRRILTMLAAGAVTLVFAVAWFAMFRGSPQPSGSDAQLTTAGGPRMTPSVAFAPAAVPALTPSPLATAQAPSPSATLGRSLPSSRPRPTDIGQAATSPRTAPPRTPPPSASPTSRVTQLSTPKPSPTRSPKPVSSPAPVSSPVPTAQVTGFVRRSGAGLTLAGRPYRFVGVNLYNANSRNNCWFSLGNDDGALAGALSQIPGADAFRAWFYQGEALRNGVRDWSAFDHTLAVAARSGKRVVVQLSGEGGDCGDYPRGVHKDTAWFAGGYRTAESSGTSYYDWVRQVVTRYKENPAVLAYMLVGEAQTHYGQPCDAATNTADSLVLRSFVDDVGSMIKKIDPAHLVSLGVIGSGQCGASGSAYVTVHASPYLDLCTREDYGQPHAAMPGDAWNGMRTRIDQCRALGKPIFVPESGIKLDAEAGGSVATRAAMFDAKLEAQLAAGVVGELIWDYTPGHSAAYGGGDPRGYDLAPDDPCLAMLRAY